MKLLRHIAPPLALASATLVAFAAAQGRSADTTSAEQRATSVPSSGCEDTIDSHPVLLRTTSGSTLFGAVLQSIAIYSDGLVVVSEAHGSKGASAATQVRVDPSLVEGLALSLREQGAFLECDEPPGPQDLPLTTTTVFGQGPDASSHTYSHRFGNDNQREIQSLVDDFLLLEVLSR